VRLDRDEEQLPRMTQNVPHEKRSPKNPKRKVGMLRKGFVGESTTYNSFWGGRRLLGP